MHSSIHKPKTSKSRPFSEKKRERKISKIVSLNTSRLNGLCRGPQSKNADQDRSWEWIGKSSGSTIFSASLQAHPLLPPSLHTLRNLDTFWRTHRVAQPLGLDQTYFRERVIKQSHPCLRVALYFGTFPGQTKDNYLPNNLSRYRKSVLSPAIKVAA